MDTPIIHKDCTKCGRNLPASEFSKCSRNKSGLQSKCKGCGRAYRAANREKLAERRKARYEANREQVLERQKAYREANREKIAERDRAYREANREKIAEYRAANREKARARSQSWREANPEMYKAHQKAWREANPEKRKANHRNRRARKRNAQGSHTAEQVSARVAVHGDSCIYCASNQDLHLDHIKPLSKGGSNWPANLAPACATCNISKKDRWGEDLLRWIEQNCTVERTRKILRIVLHKAE